MMILFLSVATNASAMDIPAADSAGARLYAKRCSTCHALAHPKRLDWAHWQSMLGVMEQRMDEKGMRMDKADWQEIAAYLKRYAR